MRFEDFRQDIRYGVRTLLRAPGVTMATITTLALGIGLNVAICSVVQSVVLHQLPFADPDRLVSVSSQSSDPRGRVNMWLANEWRLRARSLQSLAAYDDSQLLLRTGGETQVFRGMRVSAEFFATLGVTPVLGRDFSIDDERSTEAVILTHDTWVRRFNTDVSIVGRSIDADPRPLRVIGVLPETFHGLRMSNPAEIPEYFAPLSNDLRTCQDCTGRLIARLIPAVTPAGASSELAAINREIARVNPQVGAEMPAGVVPLLDQTKRKNALGVPRNVPSRLAETTRQPRSQRTRVVIFAAKGYDLEAVPFGAPRPNVFPVSARVTHLQTRGEVASD